MVRLKDLLVRVLARRSSRLALIVLAVPVCSLIGGAIIHYGFGEYGSLEQGSWWALSHLIDPGSIGEDDTWAERLLGLPLILTGIVILVGVVLEVLTETLSRTLNRLGARSVPAGEAGHVVFLGWSPRLPDVIAAFAELSARLAPRPPHVYVTVPPALQDQADALRGSLSARHGRTQVRLLFARPDAAGFAAAGCARARAVVVVLDDADTHVPVILDVDAIRRASALAAYFETAAPDGRRPAVMFELARGADVDAAARLMPANFDAVVADRVTSAIMRDGLRVAAWPTVISQLMSPHDAHRVVPLTGLDLAGRTVGEVVAGLDGAVPLAFRFGRAEPVVAPPAERVLGPADGVVVLRDRGAEPALGPAGPPVVLEAAPPVPRLDVLLIGWSHKVVTLLEELAGTRGTSYRVTSYSEIAEGQRRAQVPEVLVDALELRFLTGSPQRREDLQKAIARSRPAALTVHSTPQWGSSARAEATRQGDADAMVTLFLLRQLVDLQRCPVMVDLFAPEVAEPLARRLGFMVMPSTRLFAASVAALAFDPHLGTSFDALFSSAEVQRSQTTFNPPDGRPWPFRAVQAALLARCQAAIAVLADDGTPDLGIATGRPVRPGQRLLVFERLETASGAAAEAPVG